MHCNMNVYSIKRCVFQVAEVDIMTVLITVMGVMAVSYNSKRIFGIRVWHLVDGISSCRLWRRRRRRPWWL